MSPLERELLLNAFDSNWVAPLGPHVDAFEREFAEKVGVKHAAALSSGTAAIHLGLKLLGVEQGDDVLCSTLTFVASANPILYLGARPVFIDSDVKTWNLDPNLLEEELADRAKQNRLPRAAIVVDLYGQCADFEPISDICSRYGVPILEDAAEALGAAYHGRSAGLFGTIGIYSFNGNKIITTGGGGMLTTNSDEWARKVRFWATQSRDPVPYYLHSEVGYNYRMGNLSAAVGRGQLTLLEERVQRRRANYEYYREHLGDLDGIAFMPEPPGFFSSRWLTCILIDPELFGATRDDLRLTLDADNIESRPLWKPMHQQPVFAHCPVRRGAVAASLFEKGLCLPSGSTLSIEDLERVVTRIRNFHRTVRQSAH